MRNFYINLSLVCLALTAFANYTPAAPDMRNEDRGDMKERVDIRNGERIFIANCAACHAGGRNVIVPEKTLEKEALSSNQMNTVGAITYQVTNGKNAMPAFGGRLSDFEIDDVANFVLTRSDKGWDND